MQKIDSPLKVAIYPNIPDLEGFKKSIYEKWRILHPTIPLIFAEWDGGYTQDPKNDFDVYVFDAIFKERFYTNNWLYPIEISQIQEFDDFYKFPINNLYASTTKIIGIPQFLCGYFLFYKDGDTKIQDAQNISEIFDLISQENSGILTDRLDYLAILHAYLEILYAEKQNLAFDLNEIIENPYKILEVLLIKVKDTSRKFSEYS